MRRNVEYGQIILETGKQILFLYIFNKCGALLGAITAMIAVFYFNR